MAPPLLNWKVRTKKFLTHDVFELILARPEGFQFDAGQYISIVVPGAGPGGRNLRRAYSIASPPETPEIELCVKIVEGGPGTTYLNSLKEGDELQAQGPFGDFVLEHDQSLPCMFIGTGTGIAPLRSMVLSKQWQSTAPVSFLLGVRAEKDIVYPELFETNRPSQLKSHEHVRIALSRPEGPWTGFRGRVTDYLRDLAGRSAWEIAKSHYYLCGSGAMITEVKEILAASGVPKEQVHTEKYF